MTLRVSIVVPTLDRRTMLRAALDSIRAQHWREVEIIVVDGGSTDGSVEEMEKSSDIRLLRGPDCGLYDAFNKGIAEASGDVVGILNSDDVYEPGAFPTVADAFIKHPTAEAVCGTARLFDQDRLVAVFDHNAHKKLTSRSALIGSCIFNARFFRRTAMIGIGPFNLDYRYVSDRDWLLRWYEARLRTVAIDEPVYRYKQHPESLTFDGERSRELAIRTELLRLARRWREDPDASPETKRTAVLLEGRALASLVLAALRGGKMVEAWQLFTRSGGIRSLASAEAILRAGADWMIE